MNRTNDVMQEKNDNEILFSKQVKAGKRIYYIDVKQDRKGEYYLSMTESKRLKDGGEGAAPVFEKHKIFLYREDFEKFQQALGEAAAYVAEKHGENPSSRSEALGELSTDDFRLDIEF